MHPKKDARALVLARAVQGGLVSLWLTHDEMPGYEFRLTYTSGGVPASIEIADARAVAREGAVLPDDAPLDRAGWVPAPADISGRALRRVPFGPLDAAARRYITTTLAAAEAEVLGPPDDEDVDRLAVAFSTGRRPGSTGRTDIYYVRMAARYVELMRSRSALLPRLAEEYQLRPSTVRNLISEARRRGLLTHPPVKGRVGGELTAKAVHLLATGTLEAGPEGGES